MKEEMQEKTKCQTLWNDKWERKQYIKNCESNSIKDGIKIRLPMWNTKCNYKRNELDTTCPLCKTDEDTTEHIMVCQEGHTIKPGTPEHGTTEHPQNDRTTPEHRNREQRNAEHQRNISEGIRIRIPQELDVMAFWPWNLDVVVF